MEEIGAINPVASLMAPIRAPTLKNHPPSTHSLVYKTNSNFIVSTIIDLRFFAIDHTAFPQVPYKLPPSINNNFTHASFFLCFFLILLSFSSHIFSWACGSLCEPWKFFFKLSFCAFVCLCNNSLNGFQPNFYQHFSHVCPTCHTIFSL